MLMIEDFLILKTLCSLGRDQDDEDLAISILKYLEYHLRLPELIKTLIRERLKTTNLESDLFREDGSDTWLLKIISKEHGVPFIRQVLEPMMGAVVEIPKAFEIYSAKINPFFLESNMNNCIKSVNLILDRLENSIDKFPL